MQVFHPSTMEWANPYPALLPKLQALHIPAVFARDDDASFAHARLARHARLEVTQALLAEPSFLVKRYAYAHAAVQPEDVLNRALHELRVLTGSTRRYLEELEHVRVALPHLPLWSHA